MTNRDQQFEDLRERGFRLYDQRDNLTIKQRRLTNLIPDYQSLVSRISQTVEEATDVCQVSRWSQSIRQEEDKYWSLKSSRQTALTAYQKSLKTEAAQVQALIDRNERAKAALFDN